MNQQHFTKPVLIFQSLPVHTLQKTNSHITQGSNIFAQRKITALWVYMKTSCLKSSEQLRSLQLILILQLRSGHQGVLLLLIKLCLILVLEGHYSAWFLYFSAATHLIWMCDEHTSAGQKRGRSATESQTVGAGKHVKHAGFGPQRPVNTAVPSLHGLEGFRIDQSWF